MIELGPPTSHLPPIKSLDTCSPETLIEALSYIRLVYSPEVRGSRRKSRVVLYNHTAGYDSSRRHDSIQGVDSPETSDDLDDLRADEFERSYSLKWLTSLVAHLDNWESESASARELSSSSNSPATPNIKERLIQEAASLLAMCSGTAGAGNLTRNFTFASSTTHGDKHFHNTIHVQLRDVPLENHNYGSVGAQTWGGACVLSADIIDDPSQFGLTSSSSNRLRILELGAGTGLVSLTLAKLAQSLKNKPVFILATDYYPSVLENLAVNIRTNFPEPSQDSDPVQIRSSFLEWSRHDLLASHGPPFDQPFDLIVGADIIYEDKHAEWIKSCLEHLLKRPDGQCNSSPSFHLVIPLRPTHKFESHSIEVVFPFADDHPPDPERELRLCILYKEIISCDSHPGTERHGPDEVQYAYYRIGWD